MRKDVLFCMEFHEFVSHPTYSEGASRPISTKCLVVASNSSAGINRSNVAHLLARLERLEKFDMVRIFMEYIHSYFVLSQRISCIWAYHIGTKQITCYIGGEENIWWHVKNKSFGI